MKLNLTQQELKGIVGSHFKDIKDIRFNTGTRMIGDSQREREEIGVFDGCTVTFNNKGTAVLTDIDMIEIIKDHVKNVGFSIESDSDIKFRMSTRTTGDSQREHKIVPVFNGISVECQELDLEIPDSNNQTVSQRAANVPKNNDRKWGETVTFISDLRKREHLESMYKMSGRDLCEMIRAHFESHPTLPGEKDFKDTVNGLLENQPEGEIVLNVGASKGDLLGHSTGLAEILTDHYANTRIRQTSVNMAGVTIEDLQLQKINPSDYPIINPYNLDNDCYFVQDIVAEGLVDVSLGKVELQKSESGDVYVLAECTNGTHETIGKLSDKFLKNNPMNVDCCEADLQIVDYSGGKMKNISAKVVVDTDLMSGDVIDLDESMLAGLDQATGLEQ